MTPLSDKRRAEILRVIPAYKEHNLALRQAPLAGTMSRQEIYKAALVNETADMKLDVFQALIEEVLASEAYWRDAVKNSGDPFDDSQWWCRFCGASAPSVDEQFNDIPEEDIRAQFQHKADCAWVLSQE